MTTILTTTLYYISYPIVLLFSLILVIAAPLVHLAHYVVYGLWWWPLGILAKFETLYIFFGVATLVGVLTGTSLHFVSGFIFAALSLETPQPASTSSSSSSQQQQQQQYQPFLKIFAEVPEGRRRVKGWDEIGSGSGSGILTKNGKGIKEEKRDYERWQERVKGASRRAEEMQEDRAAAPMAVGGGKGKKDGYGDWSCRREREGEREGERGRKGMMASTILEESSSEVGF